MPPKPSLGRRIRDTFYTQENPDSDHWVCKCGKRRRNAGSGYTNLITNIQSQHFKEYQAILNDDAPSAASSSSGQSFFYGKRSTQVHGWIDLVVNALQPFYIVENEVFRRNMRYEPLRYKTLSKYMTLLTKSVESKIASALPEQFALDFDGWSSNLTHYVALFATYPSDEQCGYSKVLLAFSPFEEEYSLSAQAHYSYFEYVLGLFNRSFSNVVALIDDNCAVNLALLNKVGGGFTGCASHRFNLALQDINKSSERSIEKVRVVMKSLRRPLLAAKLRSKTDLRAATDCPTRWSSTAHMLRRYVEIREVLPDIDDDNLDSILLGPKDDKKIDSLCLQYQTLDSVTKDLQEESVTLAETRALFDAVVQEHPSTESRLKESAAIVHQPQFESGIIKIQNNRVDLLTAEEKLLVSKLKHSVNTQATVEDTNLSFAQRALKRRRIIHDTTDRYLDLRFLLPTSNICERLFSKAGFALSDRRGHILPVNFEEQVFLHFNTHLWSIEDVNQIVNSSGQ